jgi:hypothetical protein
MNYNTKIEINGKKVEVTVEAEGDSTDATRDEPASGNFEIVSVKFKGGKPVPTPVINDNYDVLAAAFYDQIGGWERSEKEMRRDENKAEKEDRDPTARMAATRDEIRTLANTYGLQLSDAVHALTLAEEIEGEIDDVNDYPNSALGHVIVLSIDGKPWSIVDATTIDEVNTRDYSKEFWHEFDMNELYSWVRRNPSYYDVDYAAKVFDPLLREYYGSMSEADLRVLNEKENIMDWGDDAAYARETIIDYMTQEALEDGTGGAETAYRLDIGTDVIATLKEFIDVNAMIRDQGLDVLPTGTIAIGDDTIAIPQEVV